MLLTGSLLAFSPLRYTGDAYYWSFGGLDESCLQRVQLVESTMKGKQTDI